MADVRLTATNPEDSSVVPVACNEKGELLLEEPQEVVGPEGPQGPEGPPGPDGPPGPSFNGQLNAALEVQGSGDFTHTVTRDGRENIPSFVSRQGERNTFGQHFQAFNHGDVNPCFSINHDGSATFAGDVTASNPSVGSINLKNTGNILTYRGTTTATDPLLQLRSDVGGSALTQFNVSADGSAEFKGTVSSSFLPIDRVTSIGNINTGGTDYPISITTGDATFIWGVSANGTSTTRGIVINLEPDNDANYVTTINKDEEGNSVENRVYNGPTLDVKEEILLLKAALKDVMEKIRMTPPAGWEVWDGSSENS